MGRELLRLWPIYYRPFLAAGALLAVIPLGGPWLLIAAAVQGTLLFAAGLYRLQMAWQLAAEAKAFRTLATPWVVLRYAPGVRDQVAVRAFHRTVETELHNLARPFGRPLRAPVTVYLFADVRRISEVFGQQCGAFAVCELNAVVLPFDCPWEEFVRHELAHLFAARWSKHAPPLLQEGLAVWLQGIHNGQPVDDAARTVLGRQDVGPDQLLDGGYFFAPDSINDCYALAGSFTGFLVRRFGWDAYRRLYRRCDGQKFRAKFRRCFGLSLADACWEWRLELRLGAE